jgi:hypothetical protein
MVDLGRLLDAQGRQAEAAAWWAACAPTAGRQLAADHTLRDEWLALGETLRQWSDRVSDAGEPGYIRTTTASCSSCPAARLTGSGSSSWRATPATRKRPRCCAASCWRRRPGEAGGVAGGAKRLRCMG